MTILARPAALTEYNQPDHNECGPIAVAACLDTLGLPTDPNALRAAIGGDAQGTTAAQLVAAAKGRDASVIAIESHDDPRSLVATWIARGCYVLVSGYCYPNAEPAPPPQPISHWYIVLGTEWQCCNVWTGVYPTYPNLAASYVQRIGCVILGRSPQPVVTTQPTGGTSESQGDDRMYVTFWHNGRVYLSDGIHFRLIPDFNAMRDVTAVVTEGWGRPPVAHNGPNDPSVADLAAFGVPANADTAAVANVKFP